MKSFIMFHLLLLFVLQAESWDDGGGVLLREVQVLTLYRGKYTTSRRSSPVPQLQCVGGSAGCSAFVPDVVQCQNKGWDGVDVQWECKTDMDNAYRFGRIEVSCEGFTHPNDPYILRGSCGLEYTVDLTNPGQQRGGGGFGGGFGSSFFQDSSDSRKGHAPHRSSAGDDDVTDGITGLVVVGLLLLLAYGVYKMFLCGPVPGQHRFPGDAGDPQGPDAHSYRPNAGPPPPGFRPGYTDYSSGCGASAGYPGAAGGYGFRDEFTGSRSAHNASSTGGGFWSGMGTGGVLGYLFGSQRRQSGMPTGNSGYSWSSGYSSTPRTTPVGSTGTRTASGFGGTKRR